MNCIIRLKAMQKGFSGKDELENYLYSYLKGKSTHIKRKAV